MQQLHPYFPHAGRMWTASAPLPGGDFSCSVQSLVEQLIKQFPFLSTKTARRYINQFGCLAWQLLKGVKCEADLGEHFGSGLYQLEVDYFIKHEFVQDVDDILWRRTKMGLYLSSGQQTQLIDYLHRK